MPSQYIPSVCPHDCPSTCALEVERLDARTIGKVRGAASNPYTDGVICAKVARYAERIHHPDRLKTPLRRTGAKGEGGFEPVSWDDALDTVAEAFKNVASMHGSETVWPLLYCGTMGLVQRDGIERLRHAMGYSGMKRTICSSAAKAGWNAGAGALRGTDAREMADSKLIVIWGTNAAATQVNAMRHAIKSRKNGAKIAVVDPYRNKTAEAADMHLALRPGTDGALACAVMHVLFAEGYADREYLAARTDVPGRFESHLRSRGPAWAAAITGLPEEQIVEFARLYGSTKASYIRLGFGFTRSRNGAANMHAVSCLPAVTGAWKERGGGALFNNGALYKLDMTLIEGLDAKGPPARVLDMSQISGVLTGDKRALGDGPPVTAMLIQNTNPLAVSPETLKVREGFARDDLFVCVHEQFMTETAAFADIVLPATTFLEHDDMYIAGGHTFMQIARKVVEPCGKSRSNHEVIRALAGRLGARHPGFAFSAWEIIEKTLEAADLPDPESIYRAGGHDCALGFEDAHFLNGFATPDGRFRFAPNWAMLGDDYANMPSLPDYMDVFEDIDGEHPFRLVTAPAHDFLNSTFSETATSKAKQGRPTALIHPDVCAELGVEEGTPVRLGNRRGSVVVHAKPFDGLQKEVVVVETIWPNAAYIEGVGINALTTSDPVPPAGGAPFHDTAVWVKPQA